ncbi:MAG: NusG domain II-containing protein [Clostridia bacterium]|nr:NusG domain II-containing protein [Clostridia bacterium]
MDKKNWLVIGGIALLAVLLLALVPLLPGTEAAEDCVIIRVGDEEYARVPLSQPQTITINQANGAVNVVEVTENGMRMASSTCQNQICVHRGWITLDNWELMGGAFVSCLPNQVLLELVEASVD